MLSTDHVKKLKDLGRLVENLQWLVRILNVFFFRAKNGKVCVRFDVTFKLLPILFANVNKLQCSGFKRLSDGSAATSFRCSTQHVCKSLVAHILSDLPVRQPIFSYTPLAHCQIWRQPDVPVASFGAV